MTKAGDQKPLDFSRAVVSPTDSPSLDTEVNWVRITSHVMTSSERLPPPPPMFVGATTGTGEGKMLVFAAGSPRLSPGASLFGVLVAGLDKGHPQEVHRWH